MSYFPHMPILFSKPSGGGRNTLPLSQIAGIQAEFDLDATLSASYGGTGQTWSNIITSPNSGASQTAYDHYLGDSSSPSTNDPTFNGTANSAAAYWSVDGGDYFTLIGSNTTYLNNLHKTTGGTSATIIIAMKSASSLTSFAGWGTRETSGGHGVRSVLSSAGALIISQAGVGGSNNHTISGASVTTSTNMIVALGFNYSTPTTIGALNARTFTTASGSVNTSTTDPVSKFQIFASGSSGSEIPATNGSLLYGCYGFNKILSDSELSAVIDVLNSRHNRTYA